MLTTRASHVPGSEQVYRGVLQRLSNRAMGVAGTPQPLYMSLRLTQDLQHHDDIAQTPRSRQVGPVVVHSGLF